MFFFPVLQHVPFSPKMCIGVACKDDGFMIFLVANMCSRVLDAHCASISGTYPSRHLPMSVRPLARKSYFRISLLSQKSCQKRETWFLIECCVFFYIYHAQLHNYAELWQKIDFGKKYSRPFDFGGLVTFFSSFSRHHPKFASSFSCFPSVFSALVSSLWGLVQGTRLVWQ